MGRKKKAPKDSDREADEDRASRRQERYEDSDSSDFPEERRHHDIDPEIQKLATAFKIDPALTQRLNDIMIEERSKTWEQDIARLYEILKEAHSPSAMLNLKLRDMEKGKFVGKAKCGPKVRDLCRKHRLDSGAAKKLEEAMSMRECMGKDVEKDLGLLDEHLAASNAPSKLVSMKLETLRKGFNIGHCIYSRETLPGNQGPGVDGVFNKREKRQLGYTDADLDKRFADQDRGLGGGQLMDEATVRRMMAAERRQHEAQQSADESSVGRSRKKDKEKDKDKGKKRRKDSRGRSRSRGKAFRRSRSGSRSTKGKRRSPSIRRPSPSIGRPSPSAIRKGREKDRDKSRELEKARGKDKDKERGRGVDKEKDKDKGKPRDADKSRGRDPLGDKDRSKKGKEKAKSRSRSLRAPRAKSRSSSGKGRSLRKGSGSKKPPARGRKASASRSDSHVRKGGRRRSQSTSSSK
mmetsp:Transcript_56711/g.159163  ORF Transcript_56711/g.159163 Transcript_56711/m.159163 type:complete len:464 (+) Transcript_56711:127-1518(+)